MKPQRYSAEAIARSAMSAWRQAAAKLSEDEVDTVPIGFKTRQELEIELGVGTAQAWRIANALVQNGRAEMCKFKIKTNVGIRPVPHYRLIQGKIFQKRSAVSRVTGRR